LRRLQLRFNWTSTALRPFDDLRYDPSLPVCGLLYCGQNKYRGQCDSGQWVNGGHYYIAVALTTVDKQSNGLRIEVKSLTAKPGLARLCFYSKTGFWPSYC